jgi:hypothetical protein
VGKGIVFVGKADEVRATWGDRHAVWSAGEISTRSTEGLRLLVISATAAREIDPRRIGAHLAGLGARAVVVFDGGDDHLALAMLRWLQAGVRVEPPRVVAQLVAEARTTLSRPEIQVTAWLPRRPRRGTILARLAEVVPTLDRLSVKNLSEALGCTEEASRRICVRAFGWTAKHVLQSYLVAAEDSVPDRVPRNRVARMFGYSDASTLMRALRDARVALGHPDAVPDSA